jgi:hypothetical protein
MAAGMSGQAGAMRMAIARTLVLADALHRPKLRTGGLLTRDPAPWNGRSRAGRARGSGSSSASGRLDDWRGTCPVPTTRDADLGARWVRPR